MFPPHPKGWGFNKTNYMKFTSQICTTKEQSERLLALGLKKETADMHYYHTVDFEGNEVWYPSITPYENVVMAANFVGETEICLENNTIPAWSFHRLIEMYSEHYVCEHINLKLLTYDTIIENIRLDILTGTFNKEYLNG